MSLDMDSWDKRFFEGLLEKSDRARDRQTEKLIEAFNNVANELRLLREELSPKTIEKKKLPPPSQG